METTVKITWDKPEEQQWLCADNIKIALSQHCKNTKFEVAETSTPNNFKERLNEESIQLQDKVGNGINKVVSEYVEEKSFNIIIARLSEIEDMQRKLSIACNQKTNKINGSNTEYKLTESKDACDSIVKMMNRIMNRMEENNQIMSYVLLDLENAIM